MQRSRSCTRHICSVEWALPANRRIATSRISTTTLVAFPGGRRRRQEEDCTANVLAKAARIGFSSARSYHCSRNVVLSDRLLGHSPMAPGTVGASNNTTFSAIPTAQDVTTSGGVWAPTSAKRDRLTELQGALEDNQRSLDDAATLEQAYDLWLCEGVAATVATVDQYELECEGTTDSDKHDGDNVNQKACNVVNELSAWWDEKKPATDLAQIQFENILKSYQKEIDQRLATLPPDQCLRDVRDYIDINNLNNLNPKYNYPIPSETDEIWEKQATHFDKAVLRYRLELSRAVAQTLQDSWTVLTKVSDQDIDRAAVQGADRSSLKVSALSAEKVKAVVVTYLRGTAKDRVVAWWHLLDRDEDGRLDEIEMNHVCELTIAPVRTALERIWTDATEASHVLPQPKDKTASVLYEEPPLQPPTLTWFQRRRERLAKRFLLRTFQKTLKRHFLEEVEQAHRLRCIYAWANKAHQDNKIDSVLVDHDGSSSSSSSPASFSWGGVGRKRYVELSPKISLEEFREVQQEHFTHLDRVGAEYMKSLREDLWIVQGKGRQNQELWRDCAIFMAVVCIVDTAIMVL